MSGDGRSGDDALRGTVRRIRPPTKRPRTRVTRSLIDESGEPTTGARVIADGEQQLPTLWHPHRGRRDWAWMLHQRDDPADRDRARQLAQMARAGAAEICMPLVELRAAALEADLA